MKGFYFITDRKLSRKGVIEDIKEAAAVKTEIIQYREKNSCTSFMVAELKEIMKIKGRSKIIINDRIDLALATDADGVHLGQDDMPVGIARKMLGKDKVIGITVHDVDEAIQAEKDGADYLGVSPIFATTTKPDAGKPAGISLIGQIKQSTSLPIVAVGGINISNAKEVYEAGADMVSAISDIVTKDNVKEQIRKYQELYQEMTR